jgi:glycerol uptake facilitator-like aquaporin
VLHHEGCVGDCHGVTVTISRMDWRRAAAAERVGTAFLVAAVVGSGIMGERLAGGNAGLALLANSLATGAALVALIFVFGPISGAHVNPVVSLAAAMEGSATRVHPLAIVRDA